MITEFDRFYIDHEHPCNSTETFFYIKDLIEKIKECKPTPQCNNWNDFWLQHLDKLRNAINEFKCTHKNFNNNQLLKYIIDKKILKPTYLKDTNYYSYYDNIYKTYDINDSIDIPIFILHKAINLCMSLFNITSSSMSYNFYEFGCGSFNNLLYLSRNYINENYSFIGSDQCDSVHLIGNILNSYDQRIKVSGAIIPYEYNIDLSLKSYINQTDNTIVFTNGALEQLGNRYINTIDKFIDLGMSCTNANKVVFCHIEPVIENYGNSILEKLQKEYHLSRGYVGPFYTYLQTNKNVKVIANIKTGFGNIYNSGYSVIVWQPNL